MRATFADESWKTNFWFEQIVLAHINFNQDLDWFYQLLSNLRRDEPEAREFKSYKVIDLMKRMDVKLKNRIWKSLQDTIMIIQDPKEYIKHTGVEIMHDGSIKFRYKGKEMVIGREHKDFNSINKKLQKHLSKWILETSPISKINFSLSELPYIYPSESFFTPEKILSLIDKKDSKKEVMGTIKLAARLCSAFFEIIDPSTMKRILEEIYLYKSDFLFALPRFHEQLLKKATSSNRFFDKGHKSSVNIIKQCFEKIENSLRYEKYDEDSFLGGEVGELDSEESIMIQACDWASGIGYDIYKNEGIKGLKEKFSCVILNGKIIQ